jgi:hypothetical protein
VRPLFEECLALGKTDRLIMDADQSGVRAIEAMEQFFRGLGWGILGKLEAAASTETDSMRAVMTEMQSGGHYANLRTEFDNPYQQDQILRGAYDEMVHSVAGEIEDAHLWLAYITVGRAVFQHAA